MVFHMRLCTSVHMLILPAMSLRRLEEGGGGAVLRRCCGDVMSCEIELAFVICLFPQCTGRLGLLCIGVSLCVYLQPVDSAKRWV